MKKILAVLVAAMMLATCSIAAMAESSNHIGTDLGEFVSPVDLKAIVGDVEDLSEDVYCVDISWESMTFNYSYTATWDCDSLVWGSESGSFSGTGTITIKNCSSTTISADLSFTNSGSNYASVTPAFGATDGQASNLAIGDTSVGLELSLVGDAENPLVVMKDDVIGTVTISLS